MFDEVLDGWYPTQRDPGGKFAWMRDSAGFYQSHNGLGPDLSLALETGHLSDRLAFLQEAVDSATEHGGAFLFENNFNTTNNTNAMIRWLGYLEMMTRAGDNFDSYTFACVAKQGLPTTVNVRRNLLRIRDQTNETIYFELGHVPEQARFWTDNFADVLTVTTNGSLNDTNVWVIVQRSDGTKEIWQNGDLLGSQVHTMAPAVFGMRVEYASYVIQAKSIGAWSGEIGFGVFSTKAWRPDQIQEYTADPAGHHRPLYQNVSFPICLDASLCVSPVLDADLGTSIVLDADLDVAPVLDADLNTAPVLDADIGALPVLDADLRVCEKEGEP